MGRHLSPRYGKVILVSGCPVLIAVNIDVQPVQLVFSWASKLAKIVRVNIGFPVVRTDGGRSVAVRSRDYQIFKDG